MPTKNSCNDKEISSASKITQTAIHNMHNGCKWTQKPASNDTNYHWTATTAFTVR